MSPELGSSTAENEFVNLGEYYVQTDQFRRALRGEARIVVGRKGSGKTAVFAQVRDHIRPDRNQIVLDLKPEGYQLRKFKEQVLDLLEAGTREHTITAFWEYLLLLEVAYKILEKDRSYHARDQELYKPYQTLARIYKEDGYSQEGDFSERMLRLTEQIAASFQAIHPEANGLRLTRQQVTEFLYVHDIRELRNQIEQYLRYKDGCGFSSTTWIRDGPLTVSPQRTFSSSDVSSMRRVRLSSRFNLEESNVTQSFFLGMTFIRF
jgi:hypothetical protein